MSRKNDNIRHAQGASLKEAPFFIDCRRRLDSALHKTNYFMYFCGFVDIILLFYSSYSAYVPSLNAHNS